MEIRTLTADDVDLVLPLFDLYRQFYEQESDLAGARAYLEARLGAGECSGAIALDDEGVGTGFGLLFPTFSSVRMKRVQVLNDFYVAEAHRGSGLAANLMEALFALAKAEGIPQIALLTHRTNARAQAHYRKMGWKQSEFLRFERDID